jgi:uracil-DNA glycosylase family 4
VTYQKVPGANCEICPLREERIAKSQYPSGKVEVAIVSRSPGKYDARAGRPFAGESGKVLDFLLRQNGYKRSQAYISNVVLCETAAPPKQAIECCAPRLRQELAEVNAPRTLLCGSEAVAAIVGKGTVNGLRGKRLPNGVVVTNNPAAALRNDVVFPNIVRDFRRAFNPPDPFTPPEVGWTENFQSAVQWLEFLFDQDVLAVDVEATGLEHTAELRSLAFSWRDECVIVFGTNLVTSPEFLAMLGMWFANYSGTTVWHNGKYDVQVLNDKGIPATVDADTLLLSYALDERSGVHELEYLLQDQLDWPDYEPKHVKEGKRIGFSNLTPEQYPDLYKYNGYDTNGTFRLYGLFRNRASVDNTLDVYQHILIPVANALAEIETYGVIYDAVKAREVCANSIQPKIDEANAAVESLLSRSINLNSPLQLRKLFYTEWGFKDPQVNKQRKLLSTDVESRAAIREQPITELQHRVLENIDVFKKQVKLRGTYIDGCIKLIRPDGRIHASFNLHTTETGRLSGTKPNLQNQPRGPLIRQLYIAPDGRRIVQADYSQAELRVAAQISGDASLRRIYTDGLDLHTEVATEFYGRGFNKEQRVRAKAVNFGILYGQTEFSFAKDHKIPLKEARHNVQTWWARFPDVAKWVKSVQKQVLEEGELVTPFGRKRRFALITDQNVDHVLKEAVNFIIQSVASDLTLLSLVRLHDKLRVSGRANIIITVHDSIVFECDDDYVDDLSDLVTDVMIDTPRRELGWTETPFDADVTYGSNWGEC